MRRLQELRRYIQEECDQLLLRKERLREEVAGVHGVTEVWSTGGIGGEEVRSTGREEVRSVATQAPASLLAATLGPSLALSSLAQAYKVVEAHITVT